MELTFKWIAVAGRSYHMFLNRMLAPFGLNASQYLFVIHACRKPGIAQEELPDLIQINKSNVTRALTQLEQNGLLRREKLSTDKRTAAVFPTQKALELYPVLMKLVEDWDKAVTQDLSQEQRLQLRDALQKVTERARKLATDQ